MSTFRILATVLKAQTGKVRDKFRTEPDHIDADLPLGIRVGGMVGCDSVPFILASDAGSVVKALEGERLVRAYEVIANASLKMHLFYLDGDGDYILRIVTNADGSIASQAGILMCQQLEDVTPSTPKQWNKWIGNPKKPKKAHYIGWETYGLGEDENPYYLRAVDCIIVNQEPADDECYMQTPQIAPMQLNGRLFTESTGVGVRIPRRMMLYSRFLETADGALDDLDDLEEHCMVSSVEGDYGGYIHAVVGIPVSEQDITVI